MTQLRGTLDHPPELAQLMGISIRSVDRMIADGMPSTTRGKRTRRLKASDAIAWASAQEHKPK